MIGLRVAVFDPRPSRCTGEGVDNHARFNMPLELGMACAQRFERESSDRKHNWLVLVPEGFSYHKFVSDLAGFDPGMHSYSVESVIREVAAWLRLQKGAIDPAPSALRIHRKIATFRSQAAELRSSARRPSKKKLGRISCWRHTELCRHRKTWERVPLATHGCFN
jgi:hypothetical protein